MFRSLNSHVRKVRVFIIGSPGFLSVFLGGGLKARTSTTDLITTNSKFKNSHARLTAEGEARRGEGEEKKRERKGNRRRKRRRRRSR